MQVLVNCDDPICCEEELIRRVEGVLEGTLEEFRDRVLRVEARLSDLHGPKPGERDKICALEARIAGSTVVASHEAATLAEAIHDAADKLKRLIVQEIRQLDRALATPQAGRPGGPL